VVGKLFPETNSYKESDFYLVHCFFHKLMRIITCILIDEMFYVMHVLTIIITCAFLAKLEVHENNTSSYMRTRVMEDAQGSFVHKKEIRGLHVSMGYVETELNGRRDRQNPVTMRSLHREVQNYREDNGRIMKALEEKT
jgi:hypothetical protein